MKKIFTSVFILVAAFANAQTADSVISAGGALDVYYDFETQTQTSVARTTWDIGFTTDGRGASIIINESAEVELFLYSNNISQWDNVDTNGMMWDNIYNSESTWNAGAFANQGTVHPDYGWGIYNMNTHDIVGNRIFLLSYDGGVSFKKVIVENLSPSGTFTLKTANLDGSDSKEYTFTKSSMADKNFGLLDLGSGEFITANPARKDWDLLFTRYITTVQQGPVVMNMAVGGVKINVNSRVAKITGDISSDDTANLTWTTNITEIGYDWKTFNRTNYTYDMEDVAYFVVTENGAMYKIWFTDYTVGSGNFFFNTKQIKEGVNSTPRYAKLNTSVYPNPANNVLNIQNKENEALTLNLLNAQGAVVATQQVGAMTSTQVNTADFATGVYFLQMNTASTSSTQRIIIE